MAEAIVIILGVVSIALVEIIYRIAMVALESEKKLKMEALSVAESMIDDPDFTDKDLEILAGWLELMHHEKAFDISLKMIQENHDQAPVNDQVTAKDMKIVEFMVNFIGGTLLSKPIKFFRSRGQFQLVRFSASAPSHVHGLKMRGTEGICSEAA